MESAPRRPGPHQVRPVALALAGNGLGRRVRAVQQHATLLPSMETLTFISGLSALLYLLALLVSAAAMMLAIGMALEPLWRQIWASTRPR